MARPSKAVLALRAKREAAKAAREERARKQTVHVAIIMKKDQLESHRSNGDYSCFLSFDKEEVTTKALERAESWQRGGYGPYVVGLGTLQEYAVPIKHVPYKVEKA